MEDGRATCVDAPTTGPATSCTVVGGKFKHPNGSIFQFNADGTTSTGTYTFKAGLLTFNTTSGLCSGAVGSYALTFAPDWSQFTMALASDPGQLRAEGYDAYTYVATP